MFPARCWVMRETHPVATYYSNGRHGALFLGVFSSAGCGPRDHRGLARAEGLRREIMTSSTSRSTGCPQHDVKAAAPDLHVETSDQVRCEFRPGDASRNRRPERDFRRCERIGGQALLGQLVGRRNLTQERAARSVMCSIAISTAGKRKAANPTPINSTTKRVPSVSRHAAEYDHGQCQTDGNRRRDTNLPHATACLLVYARQETVDTKVDTHRHWRFSVVSICSPSRWVRLVRRPVRVGCSAAIGANSPVSGKRVKPPGDNRDKNWASEIEFEFSGEVHFLPRAEKVRP